MLCVSLQLRQIHKTHNREQTNKRKQNKRNNRKHTETETVRLLSLVHEKGEINNEFNSVARSKMIQSEHKENYHLIKLRDATRLFIVLFSLRIFSALCFCLFSTSSGFFQLILRLRDL